jgi:uncharacterized Zn-finger protein
MAHRQSTVFTRKVYAKLCEMYSKKLKQPEKLEVVPEPDICRCCGQIDEKLVDLEEEVERLEWFLAFTGLAVEQLVRPYTKICQICGEKLAQAQKFRELCLAGDQIIQTELANAPPAENPEIANQEITLEDETGQPYELEKPPKCCTTCGDLVPFPEIQQHARQHIVEQKEKDRTCKYCGKSFKSPGIFRRHVEYHPDGKIHQCKGCPEKFDNAGMLRAHINKCHKKPQPMHLCPICGKVYDQATSLKFHLNKHNGVKPYKCQHCDQRFARYHGLSNHISSRHETVRFQCSYCDMKYIQSAKLRHHILLRHEGAVLRCDSCGLESVSMKK